MKQERPQNKALRVLPAETRLTVYRRLQLHYAPFYVSNSNNSQSGDIESSNDFRFQKELIKTHRLSVALWYFFQAWLITKKALWVPPAETRLTVYRRLPVWNFDIHKFNFLDIPKFVFDETSFPRTSPTYRIQIWRLAITFDIQKAPAKVGLICHKLDYSPFYASNSKNSQSGDVESKQRL